MAGKLLASRRQWGPLGLLQHARRAAGGAHVLVVLVVLAVLESTRQGLCKPRMKGWAEKWSGHSLAGGGQAHVVAGGGGEGDARRQL